MTDAYLRRLALDCVRTYQDARVASAAGPAVMQFIERTLGKQPRCAKARIKEITYACLQAVMALATIEARLIMLESPRGAADGVSGVAAAGRADPDR